MFTRLIESRRTSERGAGGTAASVFAHAAMIGGLTWATLGAAPAIHLPVEAHTVIYSQVEPDPPAGPQHAHVDHACHTGCLRFPAIPEHVDVNPGIEPSPPEMPVIEFVPGTPGGNGTGRGTGEEACADCIYETADDPAHPFSDNAPPVYPPVLRNMRITGSVVARFVVDTTGRVEPASVQFESGGDALFESSARHALLAWRFQPAATNGHRVRILVRQEFSFRLTP